MDYTLRHRKNKGLRVKEVFVGVDCGFLSLCLKRWAAGLSESEDGLFCTYTLCNQVAGKDGPCPANASSTADGYGFPTVDGLLQKLYQELGLFWR